MTKTKHEEGQRDAGLDRMNEALKAALKTPPRKHKDEPKRKKGLGAKSQGAD